MCREILITFSEGNRRADVEKNTSNDTFVCDDDAHIVVLSTYSPFLDAIASQEMEYIQVTYSLTHLLTELKSTFR